MKKTNENTKVTLTFKQLKRLVKEASDTKTHRITGKDVDITMSGPARRRPGYVAGNTGRDITCNGVIFKNFDEVEIGDIGVMYDVGKGYIPLVILNKGVIADLYGKPGWSDDDVEGFAEGWSGDDWPIVECQYFNGEKVIYPYDESTTNGSGVLVPKDWGNIKNVKKER